MRATSSPWAAAIVLGLVHMAAFADRYLIALVAPALKTDLRLTDLEIGLLQGTAFVLVYACGTLAVGPYVERGPLRAIIAGSVAVWTAASVASGFVQGFQELFAARLTLGLGQAALSPAALSLIVAAMPRDAIGRGVSIYTSGSTLGRSVALLGGGALLPLLADRSPFAAIEIDAPWRELFLLTAIPNAVLLLAVLFIREQAAPAARTTARWLPWVRRKAADYALHIAAAGAGTLAIQSVTAWTTSILVRRDGLTLSAAGAEFGAIVLVFGPAGHLAGGYLLDHLRPRFQRKTPHLVLALSLAAALPSAALFCLAHGTAAACGLALLTLALGLATPAGFSGVQTMSPRRMRARASALFLCCNTLIGFGLGPPLVGLLSDRVFGATGVHVALLVTVSLAAVVGLAACAARFARMR